MTTIFEENNRLRGVLAGSFLFLIFSLGFMRPSFQFRGLGLTFTDLAFLVVLILWLAAVITKKLPLRFDPIHIPLGLYAIGLFLSAILSERPAISVGKFLSSAYLITLAGLTFNIVRTEEILKKTIIVWIAASSVPAVISTWTAVLFYFSQTNFLTEFALHHYGSLPPGNYPRIQSTFNYPSILCNYFGVSLVLLFAAHRLRWISTAIAVVLAVPFSIAIIFTVTPGIGGVLLAIGLWLYLTTKSSTRANLGKWAIAGGVFSAFCFLLVSTFTPIATETSPFYYILGGVRIDPTQRLLTWIGAVQTFFQNPIFGKGLGLPVAEVYFRAPSGDLQLLTDAHNSLLSVAGQAGLVGVIPLVLVCIGVIKRWKPFSTRWSSQTTLRIALGIGFISAFIYQGLVGSFEDARHLWVLIGLILAVDKLEGESDANEPSR